MASLGWMHENDRTLRNWNFLVSQRRTSHLSWNDGMFDQYTMLCISSCFPWIDLHVVLKPGKHLSTFFQFKDPIPTFLKLHVILTDHKMANWASWSWKNTLNSFFRCSNEEILLDHSGTKAAYRCWKNCKVTKGTGLINRSAVTINNSDNLCCPRALFREKSWLSDTPFLRTFKLAELSLDSVGKWMYLQAFAVYQRYHIF